MVISLASLAERERPCSEEWEFEWTRIGCVGSGDCAGWMSTGDTGGELRYEFFRMPVIEKMSVKTRQTREPRFGGAWSSIASTVASILLLISQAGLSMVARKTGALTLGPLDVRTRRRMCGRACIHGSGHCCSVRLMAV